jgi:ABC-type branched-subunit amino acid transport system ATPase component
LGRLNLLVGPNSSGKSSVLEAIRLFAANAGQEVLDEITSSRDEDAFFSDRDGYEEQPTGHVLRHLFPNRHIPDDFPYTIFIGSAGKERFLKLQLRRYQVEEILEEQVGGEAPLRLRRRRFLDEAPTLIPIDERESGRGLAIETEAENQAPGFIDFERPWPSARRRVSSVESQRIASTYLSTRLISNARLAKLWDSVVLTDDESSVLDALRIIDADIEGVSFVESGTRRTTTNRFPDRVAIAKLRSQSTPVPMNSMGEGLYRLFQLALAAHSSKRGMLLVDELENGLHYSVQDRAWHFLAELAGKHDIQVFVTSHSLDCLRSFSKVMLSHPEEGFAFRVHKDGYHGISERISSFTEEDLVVLMGSQVEIR